MSKNGIWFGTGSQQRADRLLDTPQCSHETYRNTGFFPSLDGLRCLSILAVIWHHTGIPVQWLTLSREGYLGVDLFFAISGFLITTLLLREYDKYGRISLRAFYIRRALRIFPLYYAVVLLYVVMVCALESHTADGQEFFANLPYFLSYTSNWFVVADGRAIFYFSWSLATEEQFYLVWPTVEKCLRGWKSVWLVILLLLIRQVIESAAQAGYVDSGHLAVIIMLSVYPPLLGGVVLAHILHDRRMFETIKPLLGGRWAGPIVLVVLLGAMELPLPQAGIWLLMVLLVGTVVIREQNGLSALLSWRPVAYVGMISYGMYLLHMLSFNVVKRVLPAVGLDEAWLGFPATVVVTTIVATISYRYYESWFLKQKDRFVRLQTRRSAFAATSADSWFERR